MGTSAHRGAVVNEVKDAGPAARAGLEVGDVVTAVNGAPVTNGRDLVLNMSRRGIGEHVALSVQRAGQDRTVTVETADRPDSQSARGGGPRESATAPHEPRAAHTLGLRMAKLSPELAAQAGVPSGALVLDVDPGSAADEAGLEHGDVIVRADGAEVHTPADVRNALTDRRAALLVHRGDSQTFVPVEIE
jgi:serine protease Do